MSCPPDNNIYLLNWSFKKFVLNIVRSETEYREISMKIINDDQYQPFLTKIFNPFIDIVLFQAYNYKLILARCWYCYDSI